MVVLVKMAESGGGFSGGGGITPLGMTDRSFLSLGHNKSRLTEAAA